MLDIENLFVKKVYSEIALHFSDTRYCVWDMVSEFLNDKNSNQKGIEIGSGNGKNLNFNKKLDIIGTDNCKELIKICKDKHLNVIFSDCCELPFQDKEFDYALSIAVFHHLSTEERRIKAINEMIRILKTNGQGIISVWSYENQDNEKIKRNFKEGDNFIKWNRRLDNKQFKRYYYIYSYSMLINLLKNFNQSISIEKIYNERGNWVVKFKKIL